MLRDCILRLHIADYLLKYLVKFENFYLRSTELCVPNYNEIRRLEKKLWQRSTYFLNDPRRS